MTTYVALFRGINVGGKNILPMKELVAILQGLGCLNVETYIQSGNAVFQSKETDASRLSAKIRGTIKKQHGFEPCVMLLRPEQSEKAIAGNPFPDAESVPKALHVGFLASVPENPDLKKLGHLKSTTERFRLVGRVFYLHAPDGVGKSKLAANAEKALGVSMTDRNWRTVCKIRDMARGLTGRANAGSAEVDDPGLGQAAGDDSGGEVGPMGAGIEDDAVGSDDDLVGRLQLGVGAD